MSLTEEIIQHIQVMPDFVKAEVLDFIKYLEMKMEKNKETAEETEWSHLSVSFAMQGMENEPDLYKSNDLKERFS